MPAYDAFKKLNEFRRFGERKKLPEGASDTDRVVAEMQHNRRVNRKLGALPANPGNASSRSGADISFATGRPRDPLFYWKQNNLPYDFADPDELTKIRLYLRLLYASHPMIGSCVDIYSKFPLLGMELSCKDDKLTEFYTDLFLDEDQLNYPEFFIDVGREYWTVGEAWPFATFNEQLGIWSEEELLNPDDVDVERSPFMKDPRFFIKLPETIRRVLNERQPAWEYAKLVEAYPQLVAYGTEDSLMPVSNVLLKQLKFKGDTFNVRGVPILTRAMRSVIQEEMLNSAMDAIADRLYTPLVLVRLGATAQDMGTDAPWVPTPDQLADFEEALDAALSADFRALVYHFAVDIEPVFGREAMPDLSNDFDRLEDRILQTFGLSKTMLTGADCLSGDTMIHVSRAGKGFELPLKDLVSRFNGDDAYLPGRRWRADIPTYVAREEEGVVRLGRLDAAWFSGVKEVFQLTTVSGKTVTASAEHPFLTETGGWVNLKDLSVGDRVQVNTGRNAQGRTKRVAYKTVHTCFHPYQANDGLHSGRRRHKVAVHRLVMEAVLNGLSYDEMLRIVREEETRSKELIYLPSHVHVHHRDGDHRNNMLSNLEIMDGRDHLVHHAGEHARHVLWQVGSETIVSIESRGEQPTYDLGMADDPHNFLADDFVVHNSGQTYAADALNRDLISQLLTTYQSILKRHYRQRALIVAEAQEHYDYEERNGKRYVITEEILETDEETGEERIVEQPKLLIPDMHFQTMNLRDEEQERQFLEGLAMSGVPVSIKTRLINIPISFEEEVERKMTEQVDLAVAEQETRKRQYQALRDANLPIPQDLKNDFAPQAVQNQQGDTEMLRTPTLGQDPTGIYPNIAPTPEDMALPTGQGVDDVNAPVTPAAMVIPMPMQPSEGQGRPAESDEQRGSMPKAGGLPGTAELWRKAKTMRGLADEHLTEEEDKKRGGGFATPRHVGMRRYVALPEDLEVDDAV